MNNNKHMIKIADTTLRDGEQAPGVVFSLKDKVITAIMLHKLGVDEVEIGTPAVSKKEKKDIETLISLGFDYEISCWCRAVERDIEECIETGADIINISLPVSDILLDSMGKDRNWVYDRLDMLRRKKYFSKKKISIGLQDASRSDMDFLIELTNAVSDAGAFRVRYADTVGILNPMQTHRNISRLRNETRIEAIEFHGHNDLGMGVGNSIAAAEAGANYISATVNGLGERAGNCPVEELYFAMKYSMGEEYGRDLTVIKALCEYIAEASKRTIPENKPVTGSMVYKHESGIHVGCLEKNIRSYQLFSPEESGGDKISYVIGIHSGAASLRAFFLDRGIELTEAELPHLLQDVKKAAYKAERALESNEVIEIYRKMHPASAGKGRGKLRS